MKYLMTAAALCLGMMSAQAQTTKATPTATAAHNCVATTTGADWKGLGVTDEQTTKLKSIQAECMKASDKMKADNMDAKDSPMLDKYEGQVKEVLTPEQYDKWLKECSTRASMDSKPMKSDKPAQEKY